jgi:hypothetical protein
VKQIYPWRPSPPTPIGKCRIGEPPQFPEIRPEDARKGCIVDPGGSPGEARHQIVLGGCRVLPQGPGITRALGKR